MPSKTPKQARFMAAVAHNPKFAQKVGVPQEVGEEFNDADADAGVIGNNKRAFRSQMSQTFGKGLK